MGDEMPAIRVSKPASQGRAPDYGEPSPSVKTVRISVRKVPFPAPKLSPPENPIIIQFCSVSDFTVPALRLQIPHENKS